LTDSFFSAILTGMNKKNKDREYTRESMHKREGVNWYERRRGWVVNWNAIKQFFQSRVGQKWDNVWSEFCHEHDSRTLAGKESRDYALSLVEVEPEITEKGKVLLRWRWYRHDSLYVHPLTGVLSRAAPRKHVHKTKSLEEQLLMIDGRGFFRWEEIWYEVLFRDLPPKKPDDTIVNRLAGRHAHYSVRDIFEETNRVGVRRSLFTHGYYGFSSYWEFENHYVKMYGKPVYCYDKRQVGKKDIKKIKAYIAKYSKKVNS
jgi:hypothetical protein